MMKATRLLTVLAAALVATISPGLPATNATPTQVTIDADIIFGLAQWANMPLFRYIEPTSTTCLFAESATVVVPPATSNQAVNLATLFPSINTAVAYCVTDISYPGQQVSIGMASGGSRFTLAANGFLMARVNGTAPTLYVDNASASASAILRVVAIGN